MGGARGNALLTSLLGAVLLLLLAIEGATIPWINPLLSVHVFVGLLLLGPVAVKLGSTGYRFARYYRGRADYTRRGPPAPIMRFVVAPILVLSTLVCSAPVSRLSPVRRAAPCSASTRRVSSSGSGR